MKIVVQLVVAALLCTGVERAGAQAAPASLPDAPSRARANAVATAGSPQSVDRSRRELLAGDVYVPLSTHQKFHTFVRRTYSPYTFFSAAWSAGWAHATGENRYGPGFGGFAKQFGASVADTEARSFFGTFLFPTLLHQDPRYLPKRTGSWGSRVVYAVSRVAITRNDAGNDVFNSSELLAIGFSKGLSNAWLPDRYRGWGDTFNRVLGAYQGDATSNVLREFWPDIMRAFHRHAPGKIRKIEKRIPGAQSSEP